PPYSFLELERLRESLQIESAKRATLEEAATARAQQLISAQEEAKQAESTLRQLREKSEAAEAPAVEIAAQLRSLGLTSRQKTATAKLRKAEETNEKLQREQQAVRVQILEKTVAIMSPQALFSRKDLDAQLLEIGKADARLQRELASTKLNQDYADAQWMRARQKQDQEGALETAGSESSYWRASRQIYQQTSAVYSSQLERLAPLRTIWEHRFEVHRGVDESAQLTKWRAEVTQQIENWQRDLALRTARITESRREMEQLASGTANNWSERQRRSLQSWIDIQQDDASSIAASLRLAEKLAKELENTSESRVAKLLASTAAMCSRIWNLELTTIDERPITVSKVILGILLFIMGAFVARIVSRQAARRLLARLKVNESAAHAVQTVVFYSLLVTFTLLALQVVNVPLTAFTILGGALAIGLGFGSQNIMNNFISGLILLIERPIKIGDLVQIGDMNGLVESIGARSTLIRSGENIDIVVPNSQFLESNVINWTRTNRRVRVEINVGVAYGSPCERVRELLFEALEEQKRVLKNEKPLVYFTDFGDNALMFRVLFWVSMRSHTDRMLAETDVRFAIDRLFSAAGVVIAYPQCDVHLNVTEPIPVLVSNPSS
ncbi:MAG: potassium efflux system protein, partial [Rhodothermales bacterium]